MPKKGPRRVLIVHDYAGTRGGAELVAQQLREGLRAKGVDARLITSRADPSTAEAAPDYSFWGTLGGFRAAIEVANIPMVPVLRKVLRDFDPEVVHLCMILTQTSPLILPLIADRAVVLMINQFRPICPNGTRLLPDGTACPYPPGLACLKAGCFRVRGWIPRMLQLRLYGGWLGAVDRIVTPSQSMAEMLGEHGLKVHEVLPHCIDGAHSSANLAPYPLIAFGGRLTPEKGVDVLLRALARISTGCPEARLWILGDGPERARLEILSDKLAVSGKVTFFGHIPWDEAQEKLAAAWIQCIPSLWEEPFGLVTAEAQLRGTVTVASRVGAQPELIQDGVTGFLVPPGDSGALAAKLEALLKDPAVVERIGKASRAMAHDAYDCESMMIRLIDLYDSILEEE